jgi:hypothetical protein
MASSSKWGRVYILVRCISIIVLLVSLLLAPGVDACASGFYWDATLSTCTIVPAGRYISRAASVSVFVTVSPGSGYYTNSSSGSYHLCPYSIFAGAANCNTVRGQVYTIAGQKGTSGYQNGAALSAIFNNPFGVAYDTSGILYISDQTNNIIRAYDPTGECCSNATYTPPTHFRNHGRWYVYRVSDYSVRWWTGFHYRREH